MATRQELEQAITILETNRDVLQDDVANTAVAALREKILALQVPAVVDLQQNTTVLVADLSGFTAMSELMDAEEVRDTINAVWHTLDSVIVAWGGRIDQHTGDGVVALFNITSSLSDCAERAVLAALDMHLELTLFNQKENQEMDVSASQHVRSDTNLRMRIGIHTGPVLFGKVGSSLQYTAVGDTITIAYQLERAAPVGGILISDDVFTQVQRHFETDAASPLLLTDSERQMPVYVVQREKRRARQDVNREKRPDEARFVGRSRELDHLQLALETSLETNSAQIVFVQGEAGIGKSRLRIEFEKLLAIQPVPMGLFKGTAMAELATAPYAALGSTLRNYFDIHRCSSPEVARAKLVNGIVDTLSDEDTHARERAHFIGHMIGFDFADSQYFKSFKDDVQRIRRYAFQDMSRFFQTVTTNNPTVLLMENMELADEGTINLLEHLVRKCADRPLLVVCLGRPSLLTAWPSSQFHLTVNPNIYSRLDLEPLAPIDSRHLITDRLRNIPRPPQRLIDLIAEAAAGNPFLIIELTEMLGEVGVINKSGKQWQIHMGPLNDLRGKLTLEWLLQKQLARLTPLERTVLDKAAVAGMIFWDAAVEELIFSEDSTITTRQVRTALQSLERQNLVFRRTTSTFPNAVEYRFRYNALQQATYMAQPQAQRQSRHAQYATWLNEQKAPSLPNLAATIAHHWQQADDKIEAASWYRQAAGQSQKNCMPATTTQYYRQALNMLPETADSAPLRIQLTEELGTTLRQQARFDKAIAVFTDMQAVALTIGDAAAAARALRHLPILHNFQGEHQAALDTARQAGNLTRTHQDAGDLAAALAAKGWAHAYLGDLTYAHKLGEEALAASSQISARWEMAYSQALLGTVNLLLGQFDRAQAATKKALTLFRESGDLFWEGLILAQSGRIAFAWHDYTTAVSHFEKSLQLAENNSDHYIAMNGLRQLSQIAQQQQAFEAAETYQQQALLWAEKSGNTLFRIEAAADLGRLYLAWQEMAETAAHPNEYLRQARLWIEYGWELAEQSPPSLPRNTIQIEMARLLLAEQTPIKALGLIKAVLAITREENFLRQGILARQTCAIVWRELGNIAAALPPAERTLVIDGQTYDIADCFNQSIEILTELNAAARLEKARSLFAWAVYELRWGNHQRGESLWQEAQAIFAQLGMTEEVARMEHFAV